jgi:uncharacterized protein YyaL (SSP411 family)
MTVERRPNRLAAEKSPYLLQHAHNPVDWYAWGPEALTKSKSENRPIFLSIGYSTCHWCHVMEHESFENDQIATLLNEKFVPIKVDREERPDLDEIYMRAILAMHGQGGWPLSVFLTPDLKPFYGGTYFPPVSRHGIPGFMQVLEFISDLWTNKHDEILRDSDEIVKSLQNSYVLQPRDNLPKSILDDSYAQIVSVLDEQYGGFSSAPKFPLPTYSEFLLRYYLRSHKEPALKAVRKTLQSMSVGGIRDHAGGGFHRYSTDRFWLVPHFEKMLYDNAQLARVYLEAYQVTGDGSMLETAANTLEWMLREMRSPEGGFYSAQDADTPEGEGYYYTWTPSEIAQVVGTDDARLVCEFFDVTAEGNFEGGRSILHIKNSLERVASKSGVELEVAKKVIADAKIKLLMARQKRTKPAVDDKVLSSWNGLAISAFAHAYQVTGEQKYLDAARDASSFVVKNLIKSGRLLRRYRAGDAAIDGALDDYAFMVAALLDMYETTFEPAWLREGINLTESMLELFWDASSGGFMSSSSNLLLKVKEGYDGPMPSGNAVAALTLLRLSELTGREEFRLKSEATMKVFVDGMESSPFSHTYMMCALDFWFGSREIVVAGDQKDPRMRQMLLEIRKRFLPDKVLAAVDDSVPELSLLTQGKTGIGGNPTVFICRNFACRSPITQLQPLLDELNA